MSRPATSSIHGPDAFEGSEWLVPLADVAVDQELVEAARKAVESGWWSMGPRVAEFEQRFAELCDARHAIAVANGTAALHLALLAAECGPGDEVILPSLNFVAAANAIAHTGATPVFCDVVGAHDLNLDPGDVEAALSPSTKAIVVLHYGGFPCAMDEIRAIAERRQLVVIEDAAHAPGASIRGQMCGTLGDLGCFSFFSNKNLPIGEGGMVVTDDGELAKRVRLLRSHGMTTLTWDRHRGHAHTYDVVAQGFNYRLDEVRAAVGLVQLERLEAANRARAGIVASYRKALAGVTALVLPFREEPGIRSAHHLAAVVLPEEVSRDEVRERLRDRRIQTSVHYPPIHRFSLYRSLATERLLPRTDELADRLLTLPLYPQMGQELVDYVIESFLAALSVAR
jgi:dTDP-4-amino-4,6-dideoxygalactose transaminase